MMRRAWPFLMIAAAGVFVALLDAPGPPALAQTSANQPAIAITQTNPVVLGGACTNQVATAIAAGSGAPTCTTVTSAYVDSSIPAQTTGAWTPIDSSGAGLTFTSVSATYYTHGNVVFVQWELRYPVTANGAAAVIGGLPFTTAKSGAFAIGLTPVNPTIFFVGSGLTTIQPQGLGGAALTNVQLSNGFVWGSGFYFR